MQDTPKTSTPPVSNTTKPPVQPGAATAPAAKDAGAGPVQSPPKS
jgi:hypothetical protein